MDFDPATELAAHAAATEELEFLLTARRCLSDEMLPLDLLISTLFAEVCPDLADAADTKNTRRSKRRSVPDGNTLLDQTKNISPDGNLQTSQLARARIALLAVEHRLCRGDLIFRSWGDNNTTALVGAMAERAVCVAPLIVLRILPNVAVLPGYLHWFMNLSLTRSHINNYPRERTSRVISPALLAGLKVVVPAINRQEKILQIAQLDLQARAMEDRIVEIRRLET
jgi:hypothetical protein